MRLRSNRQQLRAELTRLVSRQEFALKLRFDSSLVYDRPYFLDPFVSKLIEYVFGKQDSLPDYMAAKQDFFRRAVEAQTRGSGEMVNRSGIDQQLTY